MDGVDNNENTGNGGNVCLGRCADEDAIYTTKNGTTKMSCVIEIIFVC